MASNPLNELKRRLEDDSTPLPKRLCLAKNVIQTHYFPTAPKERIVSDWLEELGKNEKLAGDELKNILNWANLIEESTSELKNTLIKILAQYVQKNPIQGDELSHASAFLENEILSSQFNINVEEFLIITKMLLKYLNDPNLITDNLNYIKKLFNNMKTYFKESKRKLEFILKFLSGDNIEMVFDYMNYNEMKEIVIDLCQTILFPMTKKSFYARFLQTLIKKDNIDDLIADIGDNIQSVVKIMSAFFTFPNGRISKDLDFLTKFMDVFVSCYKTESQVIFMFYIMAVNSLNMQQNYLNPAMIMPPIQMGENSEKLKRNIFLNMLKFLIDNDVDVNINLTEVLGEKLSKVEVKKSFMTFLQAVMMGQLKLEGKIDKATFQIVKSALKLDPTLIEQRNNQIIPPVMAAKKNCHSKESYIEMLEYLLEVLFKLSRGMLFINQILPHLKIILEASNTEQFGLKQELEELKQSGLPHEKIESKIITGEDVFPAKCVERFGCLSSDLLFRQNSEFLLSLQRDFEDHCLLMLEEGFVSPSIITIAEVMSAILSSVFDHNKMSDHTVPENIAQDFWKSIENFENDFLKKFGECILKLNHNRQLTCSFLKLCLSTAQLKLLNRKYANVKWEFFTNGNIEEAFDLSLVLPCLNSRQWMIMANRCKDHEAAVLLNDLLLLKIMVVEMLIIEKPEEIEKNSHIIDIKSHLVKEVLSDNSLLERNSYFSKNLLNNIDHKLIKQISKGIYKLLIENPGLIVLKNEAVLNNKSLLSALVMETLKNVLQILEKIETTKQLPLLSKVITKSDFSIEEFFVQNNFEEYFKHITVERDFVESELVHFMNCIEILKQLKIHNLEEKYQLTTIFILFILKKVYPNKKLKKNIDLILQIIYELSPKHPDLYKIFPIDYMFDFENDFLQLATLAMKVNNLLVIKCLLKSTVKKVKIDSETVRKVVKILLTKQKNNDNSNIECFSDPVFQISCMILPIVGKEKKAITTSAYRSILAELQEKLHKSLLKIFKCTDFSVQNGNTDDNNVATLNAMEAYSLTLSKYCESNDTDAIKDLGCLWAGLEHFVNIALNSLQNTDTKSHHVNTSILLLNIVLRHMRKLESHQMFENKDEIFLKIWQCLKSRLYIVCNKKNKHINSNCLDEISVTMKFLCELSSVDCFRMKFIEDLSNMMVLKKPSSIEKEITKPDSTLITHVVARKMWKFCLKSNIIEPKCVAITKHMYRSCRNLIIWIRNNYDTNCDILKENIFQDDEISTIDEKKSENLVKISNFICEIIKADVDSVCDVILAAKKISLDYKFMDAVFEMQQMLLFILGLNIGRVACDISWQSFFVIYEASVSLSNALLLSREELLEDRWPCFLQNYRLMLCCLCEKSSSSVQLDKATEDRLGEVAHTIEKLTQSICKRKAHVSRLAAYVVADICHYIERFTPSRYVRQHLENVVVLLIQTADSVHAMAFLRRALAGAPGQITMTNLYTMYKRYHKYVGNA